MANNQNGGQNGGRSVALPPENRPTWSPQEQAQPLTHRDHPPPRDRSTLDMDRHQSERDPRRWDGGRGSELGYVDYGERLTSDAARRYGDVRWQHALQRNDLDPPSRTEDRSPGRGRPGSEPTGYPGGSIYRAEPMGYRNGSAGQGYAGYGVPRGAGPHRGKGPVGYRRSDERLLELVCEALADDDQLDASQIEVAVRNGEVTLSGIVEDRTAKRDAEDCVCSIMGVRDVRNLLRLPGDIATAKITAPSRPAPPFAGRTETQPAPHDKKHRA